MTLSKRKLIIILAVIIITSLMVKVYLHSAAEYKTALSLEKSDSNKQALDHYDRALRWYLPLNPYSLKSLEAMWKMGARLEKEGEKNLSLQAYRSARDAIQSIRSFYTPYSGWLARLNDKIATIEASIETYSKEDTSPAERKKAALTRLEIDRGPSVGWSVVTEIGFVGWVLCAVGLAFAVNTVLKGRNSRRPLTWGLLLTLFFVLWLVGMANA